jgi:hypothetical protein
MFLQGIQNKVNKALAALILSLEFLELRAERGARRATPLLIIGYHKICYLLRVAYPLFFRHNP